MKHIVLNKLGSKQPGNEIWSVYVILQNKNFFQKILRNTNTDTTMSVC